MGSCGQGEARDFITDGAIEVGGRLPINTHGGQLGEAYIHGMNGIAEGVRQLRGTSVNQVDDVEHVLFSAGNRGADVGVDSGLSGRTAPCSFPTNSPAPARHNSSGSSCPRWYGLRCAREL